MTGPFCGISTDCESSEPKIYYIMSQLHQAQTLHQRGGMTGPFCGISTDCESSEPMIYFTLCYLPENELIQVPPQMLFLIAATGNAFTTVLAALALTITSFPNSIFLPALVAGFTRVLIPH